MTDDKFYKSLSANTIMAKLTNHVQRTRLITSSTDKHYSLDSEDDFRSGCRNVSHQLNNSSFQNCPHPDDHTIRTRNIISCVLDKLRAPPPIDLRYTFDGTAVKIDRRVLFPCAHVTACDFLGFVESFFLKLSTRIATTAKNIFLANQQDGIRTLLELVR